MDIASLRASDPDLAGLNDDQVVDVIQQSYYPDIPRERVAQALGIKPPDPAQQPRSWGTAAADTLYGLEKGGASLVKGAGTMYGLVTGDMDNAATQLGESGEEYWEGKKSPQLKAKQQALDENVASKDGLVSKYATMVKGILSDPALMANALAENAYQLAPVAGVGRMAYAARLAGAGDLATMGADAAGAATKSAAAWGTVAAKGTSAVQLAADVADRTYQEAISKPDAVWQQNPDFQARVAAGEDPDAVKHDMALAAARQAFPVSAAITYAATSLPGGDTIQRALVGNAAKPIAEQGMMGLAKASGRAALGEALAETIFEGGSAVAGNMAIQRNVDPNQPLTKYAGEAAGAGAIVGATMGAMTGPFHAHAEPGQPAAVQTKVPEVGPMSRAVNLMLPAPTVTVDQAGNAMTADQRNAAIQARLAGDVLDVTPVPSAPPGNAFAQPAAPALPAPTVNVDASGVATTTDQRNALLQQQPEPGPRDVTPVPAGPLERAAQLAPPVALPGPQTAVPGGPMVAGADGVRPQTYGEQADARASAQQMVDTGLTPDVRRAQIMRGDLTAPSGKPFQTLVAARLAQNRLGGAVVPVEGGFVVRPEASDVSTTVSPGAESDAGGAGQRPDTAGGVVAPGSDAVQQPGSGAGATKPAPGGGAGVAARAGIEQSDRALTPPDMVWNGRMGKGMLLVPARAQLKDLRTMHPDLEWSVAPAPEFGDDRYRLEGRKPAPAAPQEAAQPAPGGSPEAAAPTQPAQQTAAGTPVRKADRRSVAGRALTQVNPESDTMLQALAKMGGIRRDVVTKEFGLTPDQLKQTVTLNGRLKSYPFRASGGMGLDEALTRLQEHGFLYGLAPEDVRGAFEDHLYGELGGAPHYTAQGDMARGRSMVDEAQQEHTQDQDEESRAEAEAERSAIMAEGNLSDSDLSSLDDDTLDVMASNASSEEAMRALGFSEEEIQNDIRQKAVSEAKGGGSENARTARGKEASPGPARAGAPQRGTPEGQQREEELLSPQTEGDLRAKAAREESATQQEQAARRAEQERLRKADETKDVKARADNTVDNFHLGHSAEKQMSGMGDLFSQDDKSVGVGARPGPRERAVEVVRWWRQSHPNAKPEDFTSSLHNGTTINVGPAGNLKHGEVEVDGIPSQRFKIKDLWDEAKPSRGLALYDSAKGEYNQPYEQDLFGNPVEPTLQKGGGATAPARSKKQGLRRDIQRESGVQDTEAPQGQYHVNTVVGTAAQREIGASHVNSFEDLAKATSYLYKSAVERLDGVVTDESGKVLGVIGGFKGALTQTPVFPATLIGEAVRIKGAKNLWLSHNHPSGKAELSRADENLARVMKDTFKGSGITVRGLIAVAGDKYSASAGANVGSESKFERPTNTFKVPVIERELADGGAPAEHIDSPAAAAAVGKTYYEQAKQPGLMLLNSQHRVVAWVPLTTTMQGRLVDTGGLNAIFRAVSQSNAGAAVLVHGGELGTKSNRVHIEGTSQSVIENIGSALGKTDVRLLDAVNVADGSSAANTGESLGHGVVYSRKASYQEALHQALQPNASGREHVQLSTTPNVLKMLGVEGKPVFTSEQVLRKMHFDHGLTEADLSALPSLLAKPVMVFKSDTKTGRRLVVTNVVRDGKPLVLAVEPNGFADRTPAVYVASAYFKDDPSAFARWTRQGMLQYADKSQSRQLATNARLQLPGLVQRAVGFRPPQYKTETDLAQVGSEPLAARTAKTEPFYSALSQEVDGLNLKAAPAVGWKQALLGLVKSGKVKQDEIEWSGIKDWLDLKQGKVSKEAVQQYLDQNGVRVEETRLSDSNARELPRGWSVDDNGDGTFSVLDDSGNEMGVGDTREEAISNAQDEDNYADTPGAPKYGHYTLPGGKNYTELLLTLPRKVIAPDAEQNARVAEGRKAVFDHYAPLISDIDKRIDAARDAGQRGEYDRLFEQRERLIDERDGVAARKAGVISEPRVEPVKFKSSHWNEPNVLAHVRFNERTDADGKRVLFIEELQSDWAQAARKGGDVASGPFVGKTDAWVSLAIKRMIKYAVDHGFDRVAFINGDQSAERYDMSKQIGKIRYEDNNSGGIGRANMDGPPARGHLYAYDHDGNLKIDRSVEDPLKELPEIIGKDISEKLLKVSPQEARSHGLGFRRRELSGIDIKVGGEGMRAFYDKIVPSVAKDVVRKLGGDGLSTVDIGYQKEPWGVYDATDDDNQGLLSRHATREEAEREAEAHDGGVEVRPVSDATSQIGFDITPKMRELAADAVPLFKGEAPAGRVDAGPLANDIGAIVKRWKAGPSGGVHVVQTEADLPESVQRGIKAADAQGQAKALFMPKSKSVYLIADNLDSAADAQMALFHEVYGHAGLRSFLGDAYESEMGRLRTANPELAREADSWFRSYGQAEIQARIANGVTPAMAHKEVRMLAVEEALADRASNPTPLKGWQHVMAKVQAFLRNIGMGGVADWLESHSQAETLQLLSNARKAIQDGPADEPHVFTGAEALASRDAPSFSMQDATKTEAFRRWFGDSKVVDMDGKPLVVYHGSNSDFTQFDPGRIKSFNEGVGFYFTDNPDVADSYGKRMAVYLSIKKPLAYDAPAFTPSKLKKIVQRIAEIESERNGEPVENGFLSNFGDVGSDGVDAVLREAVQHLSHDETANDQIAGIFNAGVPADVVTRAVHDVTGYDGIVANGFSNSGKGDNRIYVPWFPEQIKSADRNRGTFDPKNPDILFSRAGDAIKAKLNERQMRESTLGEMTPEQLEAAKRVMGDLVAPSIKERWDSLRANFGLKAKQALVDQFAPIADYSEKAYMQARLSKGADGTLEATLMYGKPFMRDGVPDVDVKDTGFAKVLAGLKGEQDRFFLWVAAQRAERLKALGLENLFTDQDISALKTLNLGKMADGTARQPLFAQSLRQLNDFNDAVLKVAEESGLIDPEARKLFKDAPYVPFYRMMEGEMTGPRFSSGLVNQTAWKKLKGGTEQLNHDLLANVLQNWSHLYQAAAKNRAAFSTIKAAEEMGIAHEVDAGTKGSVRIMQGGEARHYLIEDPYLLSAVSSINYAPPQWVRPLSKVKRLLTFGVTANPAFKIRNLIRDSISAIAQADLDPNALKNIAQGWKATRHDSQTYASMMAGGGLMRFGTYVEGSRAERAHDLVHKLEGDILDQKSAKELWHKMKDTWEAYQEFGDRSEQINRAALYEQLRAKGYDHAEANFMARDLLDFSMSGAAPIVRFLVQTVPFLNARLQGLYKLGRAAKEDPKRFAAITLAVSLASLGLLAAYHDDKDWKKREDWDRDTYWWFKIGDKAFRIPKPFEVGSIGTIAERTAELMFDPEMTKQRFADRMKNMVFNTFAMDPTPQLIKPFLDVYANKDSFSGRPIEGAGTENLRPEDRYNQNTSMVARFLGQLGLPNPVELLKGQSSSMSPEQIDYLFRAYLGWVGTSAVTAADYGLRPLAGEGARPAMQLKDVFLAGNFVESLPSNSSRYLTAMYDQAQDVEQAWGSYQAAIKSGDMQRAQEIRSDQMDALRNYHKVEALKRREAEINAAVKRVEASRTLSADEKRSMIDGYEQMRSRIAESMAPAASQ